MSDEFVATRSRVQHRGGGRVMTKQADAAGTDINLMIKRWRKTGVPPALAQGEPRYGDFETADDYLEAYRRVAEASSQFEALPSAVRDRCKNSPAEFLRQVETEHGLQGLLELGLDPQWVPKDPGEANPVEPGVTPAPGGSEPPASG